MIEIFKSYQITTGVPPYSYSWSTSIPCATFTNTTGSSYDGKISTTILFESEACINDTTIFLTTIDVNGCAGVEEVNIINPCGNLTLANISNSSGLNFSCIATSTNCNTIDFEWTYDTSIFEVVNINSSNLVSFLTLKYKEGNNSYPASSTIFCTATDCKNCIKSKSITIDICRPVLPNTQVELNDSGNSVFESTNKTLPELTSCAGSVANWDTVMFSLPTGFVSQQIQNNIFKFTAPLTTASGLHQGTYTVRDVTGIKSTTGNINFVVNSNNPSHTIFVPNKTVILDCSVNPGDIIDINIENEVQVSSGYTVNWSSFSLINPPTPTSPSIVLTTDTNGDHIIRYTVPNPIVADVFSWTLCDTDGRCSDAIFYSIVDCAANPIAVDDSDVCVCGSQVSVDVLANDNPGTSSADITTVTITSGPSNGTASVNNTGKIVYNAPSDFSGTVTIDYNYKDVHGILSNDATLTITVICAGTDTSVTVCNS